MINRCVDGWMEQNHIYLVSNLIQPPILRGLSCRHGNCLLRPAFTLTFPPPPDVFQPCSGQSKQACPWLLLGFHGFHVLTVIFPVLRSFSVFHVLE